VRYDSYHRQNVKREYPVSGSGSGSFSRLFSLPLIEFCLYTVDSPQIGHPPDPEKPVALRTCSVSGKDFGCMAARPSPQKPLILRDCPFFYLRSLRVSDLRNVNCIIYINIGYK
jgi:hypothetical protein